MAERTATDSTTITVDISVADQVKWNRTALTGDVTAGAGSNATTIANDAVTNAKAANMAADTMKVNNTGSLGDPVDMAVATNTIIGRGPTGHITALNAGSGITITDTEISATAGEGGETATMSNVGVAGVGVYKQKTGSNFEMRNINAGSNKVTVTSDTGNNEIDIDVVEANLSLANLSGTIALATQVAGQLPTTSLPAFTGAITTTAGSSATTLATNAVATANIQLNAVGNARQAKMVANTIKMNNTASTADASDVVVAANSIVGRANTGNIINITPGNGLAITDAGELITSVQYNGSDLLDIDDAVIPWDIRTLDDLKTAKIVRTNANGDLIDENDNVISGSPSVADYTALVALDEAAYDGYVVNVQSGLNNSYWASNGTAFTPLNGQYIQERSTIPGNFFIGGNNVTWTTSNVGGKILLTTGAAAAHGITQTGVYMYLISGGTGWTGATGAGSAHLINSVTSTTIQLDTTYSGHTGVPVFARAGTVTANSEIPHRVITLPALRANTEVEVTYEIEYAGTLNATDSKIVRLYLDSTALNNYSNAAANKFYPVRHGFTNLGDASLQRALVGDNSSGYAPSTLAPLPTAPATIAVATGTAGKTLTIAILVETVNVAARVTSYKVLIRG